MLETTKDSIANRDELPAPGRWEIDPGHAEVAFVGRHFMLTRVRGRFLNVKGGVDIGVRPEDSKVEIEIDMASVASGDRARDDHLRSADFFDVERYPVATFVSDAVDWSQSEGRLAGSLSIKGVTRPVDLEVDYLGEVTDPWGNHRAVFAARATINREDWGLTWNQVLESGGVIVSKSIEIDIQAEFIKEPAQAA